MLLDLYSTRPGLDEQSRRCARLLAAIVAGAILDASKPLSSEERLCAANLDECATAAIRWLIRSRECDLYCLLIGLDAAAFRRALFHQRLRRPGTRGVASHGVLRRIWKRYNLEVANGDVWRKRERS